MTLTSETTDVLFERYGPRYRWFVSVTVLLGTVSAMVTTTIVNVAIPDIMGAFGIGQERAQWFITGALSAMTVGMLLNAWLIRNFGQRRTFVGALLAFVLSLLVAGASPNESVLTFARIVQGCVAGLLQPLAVYTLYRVFPPDQKGRAMGLFGFSVILGPALGPSLGGLLIDLFNWRYVFYIPLPLAVLAILLGSVLMPERDDSVVRPNFDWLGLILLITAMGCLLTGLSNGQREGWQSDFVLGIIGTSLLASVAFIAWELRTLHPLVELRVFAGAGFLAAACVAFIMGGGLFGTIYLVPLFVESVQGFTPLMAGLLLMPPGLVMGILLPVGGYLTDRLPANRLIMVGLVFFAVSCYWFGSVDVNTPFWHLVWWVMLGRVGMALINPSLNVAAMRAVHTEHLGQGAGMINFCRQLGGAFGVNLLSVILDRRTLIHSNALTGAQTAANSATAELLRNIKDVLSQSGAPPDLQISGALHYLGRVIYSQAYMLGFRDSFIICGAAFVLALIPAWIMGRARTAER